ncbi:MAG: hypothetical protein OXE59_00785 [Bacteroidetes bacterium]|nr:hypothetical protein [Bacteroidota bacterium]
MRLTDMNASVNELVVSGVGVYACGGAFQSGTPMGREMDTQQVWQLNRWLLSHIIP